MSQTSPKGAPLQTGGGRGGAPHKDLFCTFVSECVSCTLSKQMEKRRTEALDFIILPTHQYVLYVFEFQINFS